MTDKNMIRLQQDNRDKLVIKIPKDQAEYAIKSAMKYRKMGRFNTYLDRLYSEGSTKYDAFIAKLHPTFGI